MKPFMIAALVAIAGSAAAATPTELYLATKESAVAALKHPEGTVQPPGNVRLEADALRRLSSLIGRVIGPIAVRGFPAQGVSNIVSLSDGEMESGHVDGIRAVSPDGTILLVTTVALVQSWLKVNAGYARIAQAPAQAPLQDTATTVSKALADGAFYTQALASEAALNIYAAIPLPPKPGKAGAQAFLTKASQDNLAPFPPDGLIVAVVHGERVFIFDKPLETALLTIPACQTAWTAASKTIQPQFAAASKAPDTVAAIQKAQALADQAEETFLKCYKDQVASQKFFPGLMLQARELADRAG